jgi:hypothetical protein
LSPDEKPDTESSASTLPVPFNWIIAHRLPVPFAAHAQFAVRWYVPPWVKVMRFGLVVMSCIVSVS